MNVIAEKEVLSIPITSEEIRTVKRNLKKAKAKLKKEEKLLESRNLTDKDRILCIVRIDELKKEIGAYNIRLAKAEQYCIGRAIVNNASLGNDIEVR